MNVLFDKKKKIGIFAHDAEKCKVINRWGKDTLCNSCMSTLFMRIEKYTLFSMGTQKIYFHFVIKDRKPYQQSTTLFKGKLHTWKREFVEIVYFAHKLKTAL